MAAQSVSTNWREKGNSIYVTATEDFCHVIRRERLVRAINCYSSALNYSNGSCEEASASKNLAMAYWKLAKIHFLSRCIQEAKYSYLESFKYFTKSIDSAQSCKPRSWMDNLLTSIGGCYEDVVVFLESFQLKARIDVMLEFTVYTPTDEIRAQFYLHLAEYYFHVGITSLEEGNYKSCLFQMRECYFPMQEADRLGGGNDDVTNALSVLQEDVLMHQCIAESIQARHTGDDMLKHVMQDDETLNVDMIWEVIDWYKTSVLRTREVTEVEQEAISLARIGKVYAKVLKMKVKAKEYLMRAMQLAMSMHPRNFSEEEWYKEVQETLENYQQELLHEEEEKNTKARDLIMKDLQKEMATLKAHDEDFDGIFLAFIYKEFPPKNKKYRLDTVPKVLKRDVRKKLLQQAIIHYHPDRAKEEDGKQWKVLSEEITKRLTRRYELLK